MPPLPARELIKSVSRNSVVSNGATTVRQGNLVSRMAIGGSFMRNKKTSMGDASITGDASIAGDASTVHHANVAPIRIQPSIRSYSSTGTKSANTASSDSNANKTNRIRQQETARRLNAAKNMGNDESIENVWNSNVFQSLEEADKLEAQARIQQALHRYIHPFQSRGNDQYKRPRFRLSDSPCGNVFVAVALLISTALAVGTTYLYGFQGWGFGEIIAMETSTKRYQKQIRTRTGGGVEGMSLQLPNQYERNLRDVIVRAPQHQPQLQPQPQPIDTVLSSSSEMILSTSDEQYHEIPLQWHIPESGDRNFNEIFAVCLRWNQASDFSEDLFHGTSATTTTTTKSNNSVEQNLYIVPSYAGPSFLDIDSTMLQGLVQAFNLDTVLDHNAQIISSPILMESADLFRNHNGLYKGRLFAMFSNPVERIVSYYESCHESSRNRNNVHGHQHGHLRCDSELMGLSIEEYANWRRDRFEFNWLTKTLIGSFGNSRQHNQQDHNHHSTQDSSSSKGSNTKTVPIEELTEDDLELAKYILERKCLVLLSEKPKKSWERLETYMGWSFGHPKDKCIANMINGMVTAAKQYQFMDKHDPIYKKIALQNSWDMRLYEHILQLWEEQAPHLYKIK